jgi:hypothetical protein
MGRAFKINCFRQIPIFKVKAAASFLPAPQCVMTQNDNKKTRENLGFSSFS